MATEAKDQKWRIGDLMPSELFADMPRWEREMKRHFGNLCNGEDESRLRWSTGIQEPATKLGDEKDTTKQKKVHFDIE
jgi:hypothetical protein